MLKELSSIIKKEEMSLEINDSLSSKIVTYSLFTLGLMLLIGIFEVIFIKKYLERKKFI